MEKISELMDGELSAEETNQIEEHFSNCAACQSVREDFLFFREQIKSLAQVPAENARLTASQSLWREFFGRQIKFSLSMPSFAALLLVAVALAALTWTIFLRKGAPETVAIDGPVKPVVKGETLKQENRGETGSLARFDGGGRAEIYTERKVSTRAGN